MEFSSKMIGAKSGSRNYQWRSAYW